jgi:hypothetical protein
MKCVTLQCKEQTTSCKNNCQKFSDPDSVLCKDFQSDPDWRLTMPSFSAGNVTGPEQDPNGLSANAPGARLDAGKIQASLLGMFARALLKVAEVGTHGAAKYTRGGWQFVENGQIRYDDAQWRHLLKGYIEPLDPDSELLHKAHKTWNALAELELHLRKMEEKS